MKSQVNLDKWIHYNANLKLIVNKLIVRQNNSFQAIEKKVF